NAPPFGALVPILGVISARGSDGSPVKLDGVACSGRGNHTAGVDFINNSVYVPAAQYPVDPSSTTSGQAGIILFKDSSPAGQPFVEETLSVLRSSSGDFTAAILKTSVPRAREFVSAEAVNVTGKEAWIVIPTTVGNEIAACAIVSGKDTAICQDYLIGEPLVGAYATLSVDSVPVARGKIIFDNERRHENRDGEERYGSPAK